MVSEIRVNNVHVAIYKMAKKSDVAIDMWVQIDAYWYYRWDPIFDCGAQ